MPSKTFLESLDEFCINWLQRRGLLKVNVVRIGNPASTNSKEILYNDLLNSDSLTAQNVLSQFLHEHGLNLVCGSTEEDLYNMDRK